MKIFNKKEEKNKVGRPKLADTKLKKTSLIMCIVCFIISLVLLSIGAYELNIIPNTNKLKGSVNVDLCSEIPARFRPYDAETNPEGLHEYGFTDPKFYSAVVSTYNSDSSYCSTITEGELNNIHYLTIAESGLINVFGLEYLIGLKYLYLNYNQITTINLKNNVNLVQLYLSNNKLTKLDLSNNKQLKSYDLSNNLLTELILNEEAPVEDISISNNKLTDLSFENSPTLNSLDAYNNELQNVKINNNSLLTDLNLSNNKISKIEISNNSALTDLSLSDNEIKDILLNENFNLEYLDVSYNKLSSLIINDSSKLKSLRANNNILETIDLSNYSKLESLYLSNNPLLKLDLSNNPNLEYVECYDTYTLNYIKVNNNPNLKVLNVSNNKLGKMIHIIDKSYELEDNVIVYNPENTTYTYTVTPNNSNVTIENKILKTNKPGCVDLTTNYKINDNISFSVTNKIYFVGLSSTSNNYQIDWYRKTVDGNNDYLTNIKEKIFAWGYNYSVVFNGNIIEIRDKEKNLVDEYELQNYKLYDIDSNYYTIDRKNKTIKTNNKNYYDSYISIKPEGFSTKFDISEKQLSIIDDFNTTIDTYNFLPSIKVLNLQLNEQNKTIDANGKLMSEIYDYWFSVYPNNMFKIKRDNALIKVLDNDDNKIDEYEITNYVLYKLTSTNYTIDNENKTIDVKGEVLSNVYDWMFNITPYNFQKVINGNKLEIKDNNGNLLDTYKIINYSDYKLYSNVYEIDKENNIIDLKDNIYIKNNIWIKPYNYSFDTNKDIIEIKDNNGNLIDTYKLINARKEDENAYLKAGFKDKNLYTCVVRSYYDNEDISGNYLLTDEELEIVHYLYCYNVEIKDTTGLEKLTNLSELYLYNNNLNSIKLPDSDLYGLMLANNNISGTLDLSKYENLEVLYLENNKLDNIMLPNSPNFSVALLHNNNLKNVDLSSYPNLEALTLQDNPLSTIYMLKNTTMKYSDILKLNSSIEVEYKISDKSIATYNNDVIKALEEGITTLKLYNENIIGFDSKLFDKSVECDFNYTKECDEIDWDKMELEYFMSNEIKVYDIKSDVYKINKDKKTIDVKGTDLDINKVNLTLDGLKGIIEGNYYVIKDGAREVDKYKILNPKVVVKEEITTTTKKEIVSTTKSKKTTTKSNTIAKENNDIKLSTSIVPSILLQSIKGQDRNIIVTKDGITFTINGKDIEKVNGNIDLNVEIEDIEKTILKEELKEKVKKAVILNFKNKIKLPGKILVEINKTEEIENIIGIKNINVYNYDKDKYNLTAQDLSFNDNKIKFYVDKLGYYVLTNEKVEGKKLVLDSTMLGENNKLNKRIKNNKVIIPIVIFVILITLGIVGYVCYRKKNQ